MEHLEYTTTLQVGNAATTEAMVQGDQVVAGSHEPLT